MKKVRELLQKIFRVNLYFKLLFILVIIIIGWKFLPGFLGNSEQKTQYQTSPVTRGTLIVTVSSSGQVSTGNSGNINTQASGVVKKMYAKNDQLVRSGDVLVELDLDQPSQQKYLAALSAYQTAKNNYETALANQYTLQSQMFSAWKTYTDIATNSTYQNPDGTPNLNSRVLTDFTITQADWLAAEAKYKIAQNIIAQSQTALNSAWYSLQQTSPKISAPISGKVTGLSLQEQAVLASANNSSDTTSTATSQKIASIKTNALPTVSLNLTEIDVTKVKIGNKVTLTFDAFPGKTFMGKVISIDTVGTVSSGVTTYPTVVQLDTDPEGLYSNMSAQANIITQVKNNVLSVPQGSVKTGTNQTYVQVLKKGQVKKVDVKTGISNSTQIEITSGLTENEEVITGTSGGSSSTVNRETSSPFSSFGRSGGGFGGAVRINR
ncbi:efflux RND transporter periplasmic adaptor subunit [Candidatus Microgenomates bacterium]|nr:efflux RND transporter periplasmic adaptor subunit [Candidatus Microgenomates bacterium]